MLFRGKNFKSVFIFLAFCLVAPYVYSGLSGSLSEDAITERIKPEGQVTVVGGEKAVGGDAGATPAIADIGKHRYEQTCKMCHETGLADAPKLGDKAAWKPRIAEGMEVMLQRAIQGYKAMPPKGGCSNCTNEEIQKAIEYMTSKSK